MRLFTLIISLLLVLSTSAQTPVIQDSPGGVIDGINVLDPTRVVLQLHAPNKSTVHLIGDMTNWQVDDNYLLNVSNDGTKWWIELTGLQPGVQYRYQYLIDDVLAVSDPYATLILDPWNDGFIPDATYPDMIEYPWGQTDWPVSVFETSPEEYVWNDQGYQRPPQDRLVIYELLIRDWDDGQNYQDVLDRLDYLENLGITAVELMPVQEFDGNLSWGYNPGSYFAPDKYYGSETQLKRVIDECHQRGIAVIMDIVPNHSFGLSSLVRMYYDDSQGFWAPTAENPWHNTIATHPFNVGYDFDHSSTLVKDLWKRIFSYWIEEYHVDGYRIDLSKGLTQNNTGQDVGAWNAYDQGRVDILNEYGAHIWGEHPGTYVILEHFADNSEETVLANNGFMFWGDMNDSFGEAVMGYGGDLNWGAWTNRGWNWPNLVTYMESHDHDRLMFKNLNYGNANGGYDVKDLNTALQRMEMAFTFLLTMPGPKMIWQWGEYGYDVSIEDCGDGTLNSSCRTGEKPSYWNYLDDPARLELFKVVRALNNLKKNHDTFSTYNFNTDLGGSGKRMHLYNDNMDAVVVGNFDVFGFSMVPGFPHGGTWYDYFTGNSFEVNDLNAAFFFQPGEYHIYTDQPLATPDTDGNAPLFAAPGCTDPNANNYDPAADGDDGSCLYNLTMSVDMSEQVVDGAGVHVAGNFQGWDPSASLMTDNGDGTWELTIEIGAGQTLEYKYINGNAWGNEEVVPSDCGASDGFGGYNRAWITGANSESIPLHCFEACDACLLPAVNVTFNVDMSQQTVAPEGVHLAGNFQFWVPDADPMVDNGDGTWSYTVSMVPTAVIEYKFINGNAWGADESIPAECAVNDNRGFTVPESDVSIDIVCFGECEACAVIIVPGCIDPGAANYNENANEDDGSCVYNVTFQVDMSETSVLPEGLHLAGNWQGWDPTSILMVNQGNEIYTYTTTFPAGTYIEYKYVNGTDWSQAEAVPLDCGVPDGFNGYQRWFTTSGLEESIPLHCFSSCVACSGCEGTAGCIYAAAINYDPSASFDDGSCIFEGCMDAAAVNYNEMASQDDGSCVYGYDFCGPFTIWDAEQQLCVPDPSCPADLNYDLLINAADLLLFLSNFGTDCPD
ncbi:alpha-amylase family glycosyl hydrolase [Sanyastnella coralliicola]|uniref:alpha-amylase family glycosyl hydrolase n=1 Tax=Sanyastnella coralliicola TaxID=3069118 RepID=UPI0027B9C807|nr:alpha-amylase family glycosyl hydrolase [Longitalea sp. SCSIO 12813]